MLVCPELETIRMLENAASGMVLGAEGVIPSTVVDDRAGLSWRSSEVLISRAEAIVVEPINGDWT
jgi:hypothetical protein